MNKPIVNVRQGTLRGVVIKSGLGTSYIAFRGIPFAAPPIGDLRFKDPEPPIPWTGIKDTSNYVAKVCPQKLDFPPYDILGDEDCLYLNVYTNSITGSKPVIFWIHGGAFVTGSGNYETYKPDYLLARDVVVVSSNYRLGAFGFLNLGHRVAPGNQGLKDLVAALQWVKENIANFGGDPNNVTISGASAGTFLIQALFVSPRAQGLFHKVILQSGLMWFGPWNFGKAQSCFKLAALLGMESTDPVEVVKFLRTVPANDIVKMQDSVATEKEQWTFNFPFTLNVDEVAEDPILPLPIEQLCLNGFDIPILIGYAKYEFLLYLADKDEQKINFFKKYMPHNVKVLGRLNKLGPAETEKLLKTMMDRCFNEEPISEDQILELLNFMNDVYFVIPMKLFIEDRVQKTFAPIYFYKFSYAGNEKTYTDLRTKRRIIGASHNDEMSYIFYLPQCKTENPEPPAEGTKDRVIMERLTRMWANFARTGDPTPCHDDYIKTTWEPVTKDRIRYLEIDEEFKMVTMQRSKRASV